MNKAYKRKSSPQDTSKQEGPAPVSAVGGKGGRQVRRVVATAGDTVDITEDGLLINHAL